jgi:hypothetical protein
MLNRRYSSQQLNNNMKPYTYLIKFKPTGQLYYGSRFKNVRLGLTPEEDLMLHYTTSSNIINNLINEHGLDAFEWEVRRTFSTPEQAADWETRVLKRCKVLENKKWLNGNIAGYIVPTEESRKKISDFHKDKPKTEEHKKNLSKSQKGSKRPWASKNLPKDTTGENNGMFGKHHSDETKAKIGALLSERIKGDNNPMRKVEWTEERRKTMGDKSRGKKRPQHAIDAASAKLRGQKREKLYCPHCKKDIAVGWYDRHGDKCKSLKGN